MILFAVFTEDQDDGAEELSSIFVEEWKAISYAKTMNTDCRRRIVKFQMLNAETKGVYEADK